jgi:hypothetical protein
MDDDKKMEARQKKAEAKQRKAEALQKKMEALELKALKALETKQVKALKAEAKAKKALEAKEKKVNKGTGAGGANTNKTGKPFEEKTDNLTRMLEHGFVSQNTWNPNTWITKTFEDKTVVILNQRSLGQYAKQKYGIADVYRCPDEAYIFEYANNKKVIKILEKKMQNVDETKLFAGPSLKREYELMFGPEFEIQYGFCVSEFLQKKILSGTPKYNNLRKILEENNIPILFGNDANYFETLDSWIYQ